MAKNKKPSTRNPLAGAVLRKPNNPFTKKTTKTGVEAARQKDEWDRKAKHKKTVDESIKPTTLAEFYQVGDKVEIVGDALKKVLAKKKKEKAKDEKKGVKTFHTKEGEAVVRVPDGPANTIGITLDGEYHLVDPKDIKLLYEAFDYEVLNEFRFIELTSGIRMPISSEEQEIIDLCAPKVYKKQLSEREQEVARKLVSRGGICRYKDDGGIYFTKNEKKLTRF